VSQPDRVEEFKAEIASMRLPEPAPGRDRKLLVLSIVLMVGGVVVGLLGYAPWRSSVQQSDQLDGIVIAILGLTITVVGAALFVRYSLAQFLRFWLARLIYEQQRPDR
jgi:uncharacterized membrane protein YidH (DUF202 family)